MSDVECADTGQYVSVCVLYVPHPTYVRPPLSKTLFPVSRVGKKKASRAVGNLFFFPNLIVYKLECTGGEVKKNLFLKIGKKSSSRPFLAHPAGGQETIFYLRMA